MKERLQRKCCHSSQPPKFVNTMSLEISWEVKTTKAACMITTTNQTVKCLQFAKIPRKNSARLLKSPETYSKFQAQKDQVCCCNSPIGESTLGNMMKTMSLAPSIIPH